MSGIMPHSKLVLYGIISWCMISQHCSVSKVTCYGQGGWVHFSSVTKLSLDHYIRSDSSTHNRMQQNLQTKECRKSWVSIFPYIDNYLDTFKGKNGGGRVMKKKHSTLPGVSQDDSKNKDTSCYRKCV
jgi:hypothetical protein